MSGDPLHLRVIERFDDGTQHEIGEEFESSGEDAQSLLAAGLVEIIAPPAPEAGTDAKATGKKKG